MGGRERLWRGAGATAVVVIMTAVAGCTSASGSHRVVVDGWMLPCAERGRVGGVSVDLAQVLSTEGGDYWAEVSVPSLGAVHGLHFAGNDVYPLYGEVEAPLTDDPVEVRVTVTTGRGGIAYEASTVVEPSLVTTSSPECEGVSSYRAGLVAVPGEGLVPHQEGTRATDARGRWSAAVWTEQGVYSYQDDQDTWRRVGGRLDDGACGYPPGWHTNGQRGWMSLQPDGLLLFEDERGHVERFERAPVGWEQEPCVAGGSTG